MQSRIHSMVLELSDHSIPAVSVEYWDKEMRRWRIYDVVPLSTLNRYPAEWQTLLGQEEALSRMDDVDWLNPTS